jgi:DNA repair protein RadC
MIEPHEILKHALLVNVADHRLQQTPSGDPKPFREDREFTRRLRSAAEPLGIQLLDHLVVGSVGGVSFREAGLFSRVDHVFLFHHFEPAPAVFLVA